MFHTEALARVLGYPCLRPRHVVPGEPFACKKCRDKFPRTPKYWHYARRDHRDGLAMICKRCACAKQVSIDRAYRERKRALNL